MHGAGAVGSREVLLRASETDEGTRLIPAIAAFATAIWKIISGTPPEALMISGTEVFAMLINLLSEVFRHCFKGSGDWMTDDVDERQALDEGGVDPVLGITRLQDAYFNRFPEYPRGISAILVREHLKWE